jgi:hypothetical protein
MVAQLNMLEGASQQCKELLSLFEPKEIEPEKEEQSDV